MSCYQESAVQMESNFIVHVLHHLLEDVVNTKFVNASVKLQSQIVSVGQNVLQKLWCSVDLINVLMVVHVLYSMAQQFVGMSKHYNLVIFFVLLKAQIQQLYISLLISHNSVSGLHFITTSGNIKKNC